MSAGAAKPDAKPSFLGRHLRPQGKDNEELARSVTPIMIPFAAFCHSYLKYQLDKLDVCPGISTEAAPKVAGVGSGAARGTAPRQSFPRYLYSQTGLNC